MTTFYELIGSFTKNNEKDILSRVVDQIGEKRDFLDIGSGDGEITFELSKYFQNTTAIEKDYRYSSYYGRSTHLIIIDFLNFQTSKKFNFILANHVLSHVKVEKRGYFVDKMSELIDSSGIAVVCSYRPHNWVDSFLYYILPNHKLFNDFLMTRTIVDVSFISNDENVLQKLELGNNFQLLKARMIVK